MAFALRYHYSSIDRPALKSKSHLVARATVSGSSDLEMFVTLCLRVCVFAFVSAHLCPHSLTTNSFPSYRTSSVSHTHTYTLRVLMCVLFAAAGSLDPHTHTHILSVTELSSIHTQLTQECTHRSTTTHPCSSPVTYT